LETVGITATVREAVDARQMACCQATLALTEFFLLLMMDREIIQEEDQRGHSVV
jgi:hypothetical protein